MGMHPDQEQMPDLRIGCSTIDHFNVIVFILATDHVITMPCHMINNSRVERKTSVSQMVVFPQT